MATHSLSDHPTPGLYNDNDYRLQVLYSLVRILRNEVAYPDWVNVNLYIARNKATQSALLEVLIKTEILPNNSRLIFIIELERMILISQFCVYLEKSTELEQAQFSPAGASSVLSREKVDLKARQSILPSRLVPALIVIGIKWSRMVTSLSQRSNMSCDVIFEHYDMAFVPEF